MSKHNQAGRRFAAFDIDGTIFRWQLYHELFDAFVTEGIIAEADAIHVLEVREQWRQRMANYMEYEKALIHVMQDAIVGLEETRFNSIADTILKSKGHHVYRYTLDLLKRLKADGYVIIAISGSHQQLVDRFATLHDIDVAVGRNYTIEQGRVTETATEVFGRKNEILSEVVKQHGLTWDDSYAVGDSGSDGAMLRLVTNPIAFNPDEALRTEAMAQGWTIVVERKSLAYTLQKGPDGTYVLA